MQSDENAGSEANSASRSSVRHGVDSVQASDSRPKLHLPAFQRLMQVMSRLNDAGITPSPPPGAPSLGTAYRSLRS